MYYDTEGGVILLQNYVISKPAGIGNVLARRVQSGWTGFNAGNASITVQAK